MSLFFLPRAVPLSSAAGLLSGAKLTFYAAGTSTLSNTYTDAALTIAHTNPVVADSNGVFPAIHLAARAYKARLTTSSNVLIYEEDNITSGFTASDLAATITANFNTIWAASNPKTAAETSAGVTVVDYSKEPGNVLRYGTNTTEGVTNMRPALVAALSTGHKVFIPKGTYLIGSSFTIPANTLIFGEGRANTTLLRGFTGDMVTAVGANTVLQDLTIDGDTATNGTGRGLLYASGTPKCSHLRVTIKNFVLSCLEFAADGGSGFRAVDCNYYTTGTIQSVGAIRINGTDTQAISRHFIGCEGDGCTLYDFGGGNDMYVVGGYTAGLIYGSTSSKVALSNVRIAGTGPSTIDGESHQFAACVFAYSPIVAASAVNINFGTAELPGYEVTSNAGSGTRYYGHGDYTPTLTADTTAPVVGNGSMAALKGRMGLSAYLHCKIVWGSTSTFGSGQWYISLPYIDNVNYRFTGSAYMKDASTGNVYEGIVRVIPGQQKVSVYFDGGTTLLSPTTPFTWADGDELSLSINYVTT